MMSMGKRMSRMQNSWTTRVGMMNSMPRPSGNPWRLAQTQVEFFRGHDHLGLHLNLTYFDPGERVAVFRQFFPAGGRGGKDQASQKQERQE